MQNATDSILSRTAGKTVEDYERDRTLQLAVERLFTILGEAANRLRRQHPEVAARFKNLKAPIDFANFLKHVYDLIEPAKVMGIISEFLPQLRDELAAIAADYHETDDPTLW